MDWSHPNPVFMDFETQSAADISEVGGRLYAQHSSTRLFITVMCVDDVFHVWIPDYIFFNSKGIDPNRLWPYQLKPKFEVRLYRGNDIPRCMLEMSQSAPMVAHNAYGFDKFVWDRFIGVDCEWLDSLPVARANGRTGSLDRLGSQLLGQGKDRAKKLLPKLTTATKSPYGNGFVYPLLLHGDLTSFITYAIADVEILRRLWKQEFCNSHVEYDVITVHNSINDRGIQVDIPLLKTIERLSKYSVEQATNDIEELTKGRLNANNLRSTKQVHEWLESYGVRLTITDQNGKEKLSLRKETVQKYIDSPYLIEDNLTAITEIPPVVIEVLKLRMKALRITDAKVKKAQSCVSPDGRMRDLHTYHVAGTGRFSSTFMQIHNLPHPHPLLRGMLDKLLRLLDTGNKDGLWSNRDIQVIFNRIKELIPRPKSERDIPVTVEDVCSALLRPSLMAKKNHILAIVDYSQIESRCAAWMADERKLLELFSDHTRDPYKEFASKVFGIPVHAITDVQRQVGKVSLLGLQYSMGPDKWRIFAASNKVDLQAVGVTAESVIELYRNTYTKICGWRPNPRDNFRIGGVWQLLDKAVKNVVRDRTVETVAKCTFYMEGRDMICILPSGRPMVYPEARIEDIIPPYVYALNLPPNPKATVVYTSNRGPKSLYGGLIFENCWDASTNILTNRGIIPIIEVNNKDLVWDGFNWVKTEGCIFKGYKRVIKWLDQWVTADHLIHDGKSWKPAIQLVGKSKLQSLKLGLDSVVYQLLKDMEVKGVHPNVNVTADGEAILKLADLCEQLIQDAKNAQSMIQKVTSILKSYLVLFSEINGPIFIRESYQDVMIKSTKHLRIMVQEVLRSIQNGDLIELNSLNILRHFPDGIIRILNWIDLITMETMNPETSEWLLEKSIVTIEEIPVLDLKNCGPNHCYTVITKYGPIHAHNCVQACSRDIMATALINLENGGYNPVLHVHDEPVSEIPEFNSIKTLHEIIKIMRNPPQWADGFPIECEGFLSPRFTKEPFSGYVKVKSHQLT